MFKTFEEFINEEFNKKDSSLYPKCPRCNKIKESCKCIDNDYYDAKLDHYTPKGKLKKGNYNGKITD